MQDPYEVLGVDRNADKSVIKRQYRQKAKQYHPDLNPGDEEAAEKFKELSEAYEILQDDKKRQLYDTYGAAAFENGGGGSGFGGFTFDMNDIFGDLFSDFFGGGRSSQTYNGPVDGSDIRMEIHLSFKEAVYGTKKDLKFKRERSCKTCHGTGAAKGTEKVTCPTCGGSGQVSHTRPSPFGFGSMTTRSTCPKCHGTGSYIENPCPNCKGTGREVVQSTLTVQIPKGVDNGMIMPIRGEGNEGEQGGQAGDLVIILRVEESDYFQRKGDDLKISFPISFPQAALGDQVEIPTLYGVEDLEIPAGTQTGKVFKLKGKGVENVRSHKPGNLYVEVLVETPTKLTKDQKKAMENFAHAMDDEVSHPQKSFLDKLKDLFN